MILLKRSKSKILENNVENDIVELKDSSLIQMKNNIIKQKIAAKDEYNRKIKRFDDQLLQLSRKQEEINIKNNQNKDNIKQNSNIENDSSANQSEQMNEGKNYKHELLCTLIKKVNNNLDLSYSLSDSDIFKMARKVIDTINKYKNDNDVVNKLKYELKKYCLNHNKISLSQSEINTFLNELENVIINSNYNPLSNIFKNINNTIFFNIDTNIDELESELTYIDIIITDEDLQNNKLVVKFPKRYNKNELKNILSDFDILKNNLHLFL